MQEDYGYVAAVPVLLNATSTMRQKTPSATAHSSRWRPKSAEAVLQTTPANSKKRGREDELIGLAAAENASSDGGETPTAGCCGLCRPRKKQRNAYSEPSTVRCALDPPIKPITADIEWELAKLWEQESPFHVLPNYPNIMKFLPAGARRMSVNIIFLMANTLNLELCTPGLGVLIMDRFFSSRKSLPSCRQSVILTAMICLNAAGKVADIDKGYCGSHGVMAMVRDAVPPMLRHPSHESFARYAAAIEREVLLTIDNTLLSYPCAMQLIANITKWHEEADYMWARAAVACDIFCVNSFSTIYTQTETAKAVVGLLTGDPAIHLATSHLVQSIQMFVNSSKEGILWRDPFFGVRHRHSDNPEVKFFYLNIVGFVTTYCALVGIPPTMK